MMDKEQYKKTFDTVASFGMEPLEVRRIMKNSRKHAYMNKIAAAAAVVAVLAGSTGVAYAANVGGIQRTLQLWLYGDQTNAELVIDENGERLHGNPFGRRHSHRGGRHRAPAHGRRDYGSALHAGGGI